MLYRVVVPVRLLYLPATALPEHIGGALTSRLKHEDNLGRSCDQGAGLLGGVFVTRIRRLGGEPGVDHGGELPMMATGCVSVIHQFGTALDLSCPVPRGRTHLRPSMFLDNLMGVVGYRIEGLQGSSRRK